MKHLFIILLLVSCTAQSHINKMQKHKAKAIAKGATIQTDTTYITQTRIDTLVEVIEGDTVKILIPRLDTIQIINKEFIKVPLSRQERKALKDSMDHKEQIYKLNLKRFKDSLEAERLNHKQELRSALKTSKNDLRIKRVEDRSSWKWIFLVGLVCGIVIMVLIRRI